MFGIADFEADITLCACSNLRAAARSLTRAYDRALEPSGLRIAQFTVLSALEAGAPNSIGALAKALGMDQTTLTRNVGLLARDGLLEIQADPGDTRARRLTLTAEGTRRLAAALPLWRRAQRRLDGELDGGVEGLVGVARAAWSAAG